MTGHAWPLTLNDAKLGPKNELHEYKYAPDTAVQGAPIRKRGFTKGFVGRSERTTPSVLDKYLS
jgi:hypothetical protein